MYRRKWEAVFAILVVSLAFGSCLHFIYLNWIVDDRGFSIMSHTLPYWDFSNLWAGGKIVARGDIVHLFDVSQYRADLRSLLSPYINKQEWSYPPSILLLGYPLSQMPILPAYVVWTVGTSLMFLFSLRLLHLPWGACIVVALSPAAMMNIALGQNGALTAALLIAGLSLTKTKPVLAGILFGLLTIKPQIGILVPFCLVASGNYRAIAAAGAVAIVMVILSGTFFGFAAWNLFWLETRPLMTAILEAPYPQDYHGNAISFFITARWLGFDVLGSYLFQSIFSSLAILAAIWLWLPRRQIDHDMRVCATALLSATATPYGYTYDVLPLGAAIAILFLRQQGPNVLLLAAAWIFPPVNQTIPISIGIVFPTAIAIALFVQIKRAENVPAGCLVRRILKASAAPPARRDDCDPSAGSDRHADVSAGCSGAGS